MVIDHMSTDSATLDERTARHEEEKEQKRKRCEAIEKARDIV